MERHEGIGRQKIVSSELQATTTDLHKSLEWLDCSHNSKVIPCTITLTAALTLQKHFILPRFMNGLSAAAV